MTSDTAAKVSLSALTELQSDLNRLSNNLKDLYEVLSDALVILGDYWQDNKFEEFESEFRSRRIMIEELSEKYNSWANVYLPPRIELVRRISEMDMGIRR